MPAAAHVTQESRLSRRGAACEVGGNDLQLSKDHDLVVTHSGVIGFRAVHDSHGAVAIQSADIELGHSRSMGTCALDGFDPAGYVAVSRISECRR